MAYLTLNYRSEAIKRDIPVTVILPFDRGFDGPFPTLYLLHGLQNNSESWLVESRIVRMASERGLAVVMPSGENSFWLGVPPSDGPYGDFAELVGKELVEVTRKIFPLSTRREDTFIGGCSMGGYGALRNGIQYRDTFSKMMLFYPAVHFFEYDEDYVWESGNIRGEASIFLTGDKRETDLNPRWLLEQAVREGGSPVPAAKLMVGVDDSLLEADRAIAKALEDAGVPIDFFEGPGAHTWQFIDEHLPEMLDWLVEK